MKQPLKVGIRLSRLLIEIQKSVFRGCGHLVHSPNVLPHALFFQKCLLLSLVLQIESNHSGGIDANGSLNGGIGLRRNDEAHFMMTTHERQFIQYIPRTFIECLGIRNHIIQKQKHTSLGLVPAVLYDVTNHRVIPLLISMKLGKLVLVAVY